MTPYFYKIPLYLLKNTTVFSRHNTVLAANTTVSALNAAVWDRHRKKTCDNSMEQHHGTATLDNSMGQGY